MLWDRSHGHYWTSHCSWDRAFQPAKESHFQDRFCCISFCYPCCTWTHPQPAIRMPRIISHFLYSFRLTLPYSKMTAALLARVPFSVPPCQPRQGEVPPCFSELGSHLWFLFPSMSNPRASPGASNPDVPSNTSPAHGPGQGGPPASQPRLLSCPTPKMVSTLLANTLLSPCSFRLLSTSLLSLQHLSPYFTPPYSPLFKNPTKVHKYFLWLCV